MNLELVDITAQNWQTYVEMNPGKGSEYFVRPNSYSLVQAYFEQTWVVKGIEKNQQAVGFTMYGFDEKNNWYELERLMIDETYQHQGLGREIIPMILAEMKHQWQPAKIYLRTNLKNTSAIHLYESLGFKPTGKVINGERIFYVDC